MVWIDDVVAAVCALVSMAERGEMLPAAVNVGGASCVSRVQMAEAYARNAAISLRITNAAAPADFFSSRPRRIALDVSLLSSLLGRSPATLDEAYSNALKGTRNG
jgi:hypothetical protein